MFLLKCLLYLLRLLEFIRQNRMTIKTHFTEDVEKGPPTAICCQLMTPAWQSLALAALLVVILNLLMS